MAKSQPQDCMRAWGKPWSCFSSILSILGRSVKEQTGPPPLCNTVHNVELNICFRKVMVLISWSWNHSQFIFLNKLNNNFCACWFWVSLMLQQSFWWINYITCEQAQDKQRWSSPELWLRSLKIIVCYLCSEDCHQLLLLLRYLPYSGRAMLLHLKWSKWIHWCAATVTNPFSSIGLWS